MVLRPGMVSPEIERLRELATRDPKTGKAQLPDRDMDFAWSLIKQFDRTGSLSPRQQPWIQKLTERALDAGGTLGTMAPKKVEYPVMALGVNAHKLVQIFHNARQNKIPIPVIQFRHGKHKVRITQMENGKPFNLTEKIGDNKTWFGALDSEGNLKYSSHLPAELPDTLREILHDPAGKLSQLGFSQDWCCFCTRNLRSENSVYYGYGPICADKWGLEWGNAKPRMIAEAVESGKLDEMASGVSNLFGGQSNAR